MTAPKFIPPPLGHGLQTSREASDAERLAAVRAWAAKANAAGVRKGGITPFMMRLLDERDAEIARLSEENENLAADADNAASYLESMRQGFKQLCTAVGVERRAGENWDIWIARISNQFSGQRAETARLRAECAPGAEAMERAEKVFAEVARNFTSYKTPYRLFDCFRPIGVAIQQAEQSAAQQARTEAIEEAATWCDGAADRYLRRSRARSDGNKVGASLLAHAAERIRALSDTPQPASDKEPT